MSAGERSGWRDAALSERHRIYGCDCPMLDVDFLACEFDTGRPVALVEYKLGSPRDIDFSHSSYKALRYLADASGIPLLVVFYSPLWSYTVFPGNVYAEEWCLGGEALTEFEYVTLLYRLRGRSLPAGLERELNDVIAEVANCAA